MASSSLSYAGHAISQLVYFFKLIITNIVTGKQIKYRNLYKATKPVISHGLWTGVPDLDAIAQLTTTETLYAGTTTDTVPIGKYFPQSAMNLAFRREILPALYFPPMGMETVGFDRFGDIWAGVIAKKVCDHLGWSVVSGAPWVEHRRASNVWANLRKEAPGMERNEEFWEIIDGLEITDYTARGCVTEIAYGLQTSSDPYLQTLASNLLTWLDLLPH